MSGGLDSTTAAYIARAKGCRVELALHFDYGQKAATSERRQVRRLCDALDAPLRIVQLPWFAEFQTALTQRDLSLPAPSFQELDAPFASRASAKAVWVPNRNAIFLSIAAAFAEELGCEAIVVGFNREEANTFPDNSEAFLDAITHAFSYSTLSRVRVVCPTVRLTKYEIVREARRLGLPCDQIWSCYLSGDQMCGVCESCQRYRRALLLNEVECDAWFANTLAPKTHSL